MKLIIIFAIKIHQKLPIFLTMNFEKVPFPGIKIYKKWRALASLLHGSTQLHGFFFPLCEELRKLNAK
jgi:hypothetical protein